MAVLGVRTLAVAEIYTRGARQAHLAREGMARIERAVPLPTFQPDPKGWNLKAITCWSCEGKIVRWRAREDSNP